MQLTVADVMRAASSGQKIRFPGLTSNMAESVADLNSLANQFEAAHALTARRAVFGGFVKGLAAEQTYAEDITQALATATAPLGRPVSPGVTRRLVEAILRLETDYNGGDLPFSKTAPPMNINHAIWAKQFEAYNRTHPHAPITAESIKTNARLNITAAVIVLDTIDAALDPAITGTQRAAVVASIYGHTEKTLASGRPIMYGAMVTRLMEPRTPVLTRETNPNQHLPNFSAIRDMGSMR